MNTKCLFPVFGVIVILIASSATEILGQQAWDNSETEQLEFMAVAESELEIQTSVKCIERNNWSTALTLSRLNGMMSIFMGKPFTNFVSQTTYIFVPDKCPKSGTYGNVYTSGNSMHAEDQMEVSCGLPNDFYLIRAPCPDCAIMLEEKYKNLAKPTIRIARPYTGKGKSGNGNKDVNMQCWAMLVQAGFNLVPWNWFDFYKYLTNSECKNAMKNLATPQWAPTFNQKFSDTTNALNEAISMAKSKPMGYYKTQCNNAVNG